MGRGRSGKCLCRWCLGKRGWNIHHGYLLYLIGMDDERIAACLGIAEGAVVKRRKLKWAHGHA